MKTRTIKDKIVKITWRYSDWTIGITEFPENRQKQHGNPEVWYQFKAQSEEAARSIERLFIEKGMNGDTGGGKTPDYVYIFKE